MTDPADAEPWISCSCRAELLKTELARGKKVYANPNEYMTAALAPVTVSTVVAFFPPAFLGILAVGLFLTGFLSSDSSSASRGRFLGRPRTGGASSSSSSSAPSGGDDDEGEPPEVDPPGGASINALSIFFLSSPCLYSSSARLAALSCSCSHRAHFSCESAPSKRINTRSLLSLLASPA